jgi:peptidoglycan/LPS O-acetylase OafA/YrhL
MPLIEWLRAHGVTRAGTGGFAMTLALAVSASLAVAALSYLLVEQPAMRHRGRRTPRVVVSTAR